MILEALLGPRERRSDYDEDRRWGAFAISESASGVRVSPDNALQVSAVYACVRVLSETVASLPAIVYRRQANGGKERFDGSPWYRVLHDRPNEWQTAFEFFEMMMGHLALRGNAYAVLEPDRRGFTQLVPLHPDRVQVKDTNGLPIPSLYIYRDQLGTTHNYLPSKILHVRGLSCDGLMGMSPIALQREAIGLAVATEAHGATLFKNGARPGVVLEHPGPLKPDAAAALREQWERIHGGPYNQHRTAVLQQGMKAHELGMTAEDSQFLETRKFQVQEIGRLFRVPPHMIGDLDRATFSNVEQQSIDFVTHTIRPWLRRWEQALQRDLLGEEDDTFVEFLVDALLRGDTASRYNAYAIGRSNGWLSANDIRGFENMNPIEGGDIYLLPLNMVDATKAPDMSEMDDDMPEEMPDEMDDEEDDEDEPSEAARAVLADAVRRMIRFEQQAIKRAANKPNFLAAVEAFYQEHKARCVSVLGPAVAVCRRDREPGDGIDRYFAESHEILLAVAGDATAVELPGRVSETVSCWESRADSFCNSLIEVRHGR